MNTANPQTFWTTFSAAPHRMMMFAGAVQLVVTLLYWTVDLFGRYTPLWAAPETTLPGMFSHAMLMLYMLFPFFIFGFLMTTYPRWMSGTEIPRNWYQSAFLLLASGVILFYLGLFLFRPLTLLGIALLLAGYVTAITALWRVYRTAPARDKLYETCLNIALLAGTAGVASYLIWLLSGDFIWLNFSLQAGLWWFLLPVVVTVGHRMIPFFSINVLPDYQMYQPRQTLLAMLALLALHGLLEMLKLQAWLWIPDIPLVLIGILHTWKWQLRRSFAVRLLAVLHVAFAWFPIAMLLYSINSLSLLLGHGLLLGRGPLHAIAIGFLLSTTLAMASRVTQGHSGRPLHADNITWWLFWGLSLVAISRILAELPGALHFNLLASVIWLLITAIWSWKYGLMYLRPRVDGRPG